MPIKKAIPIGIGSSPVVDKPAAKWPKSGVVRNPPIPKRTIRMYTELQPAMKVVTKYLKKDPEYRESWKANIAMAFKDHVYQYKKKTSKKQLSAADMHIVANEAAEYFLQLLCDEIKYPKGR
jgi:hypothetical protein